MTLNIHYRDHGHTITILVEDAKEKVSLGPTVCCLCLEADHTYYLHNTPLAFVLVKRALWVTVPGLTPTCSKLWHRHPNSVL